MGFTVQGIFDMPFSESLFNTVLNKSWQSNVSIKQGRWLTMPLLRRNNALQQKKKVSEEEAYKCLQHCQNIIFTKMTDGDTSYLYYLLNSLH